MSVVRWEDPPPHGNARRDRGGWGIVAEALKARPGEWAVIGEGVKHGTAGALVTRITRGQRAWWSPAGAFEARGRAGTDGLVTVYARYVGEPS